MSPDTPTARTWRWFITLLKPKMLIPMHGEHRHLRQHARLGEAKGIASAVVVNGMMMDLSGDAPSR